MKFLMIVFVSIMVLSNSYGAVNCANMDTNDSSYPLTFICKSGNCDGENI